ncbi:MAG: SoxR reducing system RseC family protein [Thermoanaerobacteraceae bacterium]|nr:SoxR reducing system RseC family protein [Thermoanaerobacteraceae bacterium]
MREKAIVIGNKKNRVQVEIRRSTACDGCKGCSVGRNGKPLRVWAKNSIGARVGQTVEIELSAATFLSATLIAYGIPLLAFLLGIFLGFKVSEPLNISSVEPFSFFMGLILMSFSFLIIYLFTGREEISEKYSSRIVRII